MKKVATGAQIKMARAYVGWSVRELSELAGVSGSTIKRLELIKGYGNISVDNVNKITIALESSGKIRFEGECCVCVADQKEGDNDEH
jgi:transcriptional regulator with XRE-family HTH domain